MKYRKKPVVIEAVRYMIDNSLPDWFMDRVSNNTIVIHEDGTCHIKTLEGTMKSEYGDYIILGVNGEVYPCKPDIFEKDLRRSFRVRRINHMKKCVILEMENSNDFEKAMNDYIDDGYKVESSSCNSRYYKAILVLKEDE